MPTVEGDKVAYRSFAGETYDAVILKLRPPKHVDVSIIGPGLVEPMELHAIRWFDDPDEPSPGARPRRLL
jgi:hypothetical protein